MDNKKKRIILTASAIVLIGAGVGYWLWRRKKEKEEEAKATDSTTTESVNVPLSTTDTGTPKSTSTGATTVSEPMVSGPSNVKDFQDWLDIKHPTWLNGGKLNKGRGYGTFGPSTQSAWTSYKSEYQSSKVITGGFKAGDKIVPRIPLTSAIAYNIQTGKALGRIKEAVFAKDSTNKDWFFAKAYILVGPYQTPTLSAVQLQTKDWMKG